ncbi:hypothetical protein [Corallococcus exercitus]|uniref:hypothetical protein n=1 Tax=Corallococcus exercitus TaxID=2316736 RepID=UPI0035D4BB77
MQRKFLQAVTAALAVLPAAAFAYPPQCDEVCYAPGAPCETVCFLGATYYTSCGESGYCYQPAPTPAEPTASVMETESLQSDAAALVCDDAQSAGSRNATREG